MLTDSTVAWWYAIIMKRIGTIINKDYVLLHLLHTVSTYQPIGMQTLWGMHLLISKAWDIRALQAQEPNSCVPWKLCLWLSWTNLLPKTYILVKVLNCLTQSTTQTSLISYRFLQYLSIFLEASPCPRPSCLHAILFDPGKRITQTREQLSLPPNCTKTVRNIIIALIYLPKVAFTCVYAIYQHPSLHIIYTRKAWGAAHPTANKSPSNTLRVWHTAHFVAAAGKCTTPRTARVRNHTTTSSNHHKRAWDVSSRLNCTILGCFCLTSDMQKPNLKHTDLTQKQTWAWSRKKEYSKNRFFGLTWFHLFPLLIYIHIIFVFLLEIRCFFPTHWIKQGPEGLVASAPASPAVAVAGCVQCGGVGVLATS